jgi:hypothetical protein
MSTDVEYQFTSFVRGFGGEVVADLLPRGKPPPLNADYFLFGREVVAELKCLEQDYFRDARVGEKLAKLANEWVRAGLLGLEQIATGRFSTETLPETCALQAISVFAKPLKAAVIHANKQLKATKTHFQLPRAKGLLILANDGNFSLNPELTMHVLGRLFREHFSAIESYIYFAPRLVTKIAGVTDQGRIWISGPTRGAGTGVSSELMKRIEEGWHRYVQSHFGGGMKRINTDDPQLLRSAIFQYRK